MGCRSLEVEPKKIIAAVNRMEKKILSKTYLSKSLSSQNILKGVKNFEIKSKISKSSSSMLAPGKRKMTATKSDSMFYRLFYAAKALSIKLKK
jgi:hypothetical protein